MGSYLFMDIYLGGGDEPLFEGSSMIFIKVMLEVGPWCFGVVSMFI